MQKPSWQKTIFVPPPPLKKFDGFILNTMGKLSGLGVKSGCKFIILKLKMASKMATKKWFILFNTHHWKSALILYLNWVYKETYQHACHLRLWYQKENIFSFITLGYCSRFSQKKGIGLVFSIVKCTGWTEMCQTIYQSKGNIKSCNQSYATTLLSVIIWEYGQK